MRYQIAFLAVAVLVGYSATASAQFSQQLVSPQITPNTVQPMTQGVSEEARKRLEEKKKAAEEKAKSKSSSMAKDKMKGK